MNGRMINYLMLALSIVAVHSTLQPCNRLYSLCKVTCWGDITRKLTIGYLTSPSMKCKFSTVEIINTDIFNINAEWTDGKNNITYLRVNFNDKLNTLSNDSFKNLGELKRLDLKSNNISTLDNNIFYPLTKLEYLNMEHNNLHELETGVFSRQRHLKILNLKHNMIKEINSVVLNTLLSLEELYLNENILEKLDGRCFMSLENLRVLNLSNNHLWKLPSTLFQYQKRLKELHMDENNFKNFDLLVLSHLHDLQNFTFRNNNIHTWDFEKFERLTNLRHLDLLGCHISCGCSAKIFIQTCFERSIELKMTCKTGKGQNLVNASEYLLPMDCSIVEKPRLELFIILGLLFFSLIVDVFVSWINIRYDLSMHRACSSESVNEYEYVENFKDLEEKAYTSGAMRDSGKHQSVLQKVMSIYDYLRPLPGRRMCDESAKIHSNPPLPRYDAPSRPQSDLYDVVN